MSEPPPEPILSRPARCDLADIEDSIASRRGEEAARAVLHGLAEQALRHARFPRTGRIRDDLGPGIRSFYVHPYVVFFRPIGERIELVRILHHRRNVDAIVRETLEHFPAADEEE